MSLINKMLQDLESRKNPRVEAAQKKSVYEDLKPLSRVSPSRVASGRMAVILSAIAVVGAGAYGWMQWGDSLVSGLFPEPVATQPPPVVARKAQPPRPAAVPAPAPSTAATASQLPEVNIPPAPLVIATGKMSETPVTAAPTHAALPGAMEQKKSTAIPAPAAPQKTVPAKSKVSSEESRYWTVSRGETLYGISAKTGVELWNLSNWNRLGREHVIHVGQRLRLTPPATTPTSAGTQTVSDKTYGPAQQQQQAVTSMGAAVTQKPESKAKSTVMPSDQETQAGHAVMDKKLKPLSPDEKAESEYHRAADLLQKGRMADAEKHLKSALHASEAHTPSRELLVGVLLQQGHWREAQQLLEQGIDTVPTHYPFAQLLARIYVEHGADQKALTVLEASRRVAADNPDYVAFLAALYQRVGKHVEAVKTYTEAVTLSPQEGRWWLGLGISFEAVQDRDAAGAAYQRAIHSGTLDDHLLKYARQRLAVVKNN